MVTHTASILERLHLLFREGELVRELMSLPGLQLEIYDEDQRLVQLSHTFNSAFALEDAAKLAASLDLEPEPWQGIIAFRTLVHALRDAIIRFGGVTPRAIQYFVETFVESYQGSLSGLQLVTPIERWRTLPGVFVAGQPDSTTVVERLALINSIHTQGAAFVDNPPRRVHAGDRRTEPLEQIIMENGGLDPTPVGFLLVGISETQEYIPVICNVTTSEALVYRGSVAPGARFWLRPTGDGHVQALMEQDDVTDRLESIQGFAPGVPWGEGQVQRPAQEMTLVPGPNRIWFFPLAHYNERGLDRFLLAMPDLTIKQGRFGGTAWNQSLFYQRPAIALHASWVEVRPASYEIHLPAGLLRQDENDTRSGLEVREGMAASLSTATRALTAVGVDGNVIMRPFSETQRQGDTMFAMARSPIHEVGPVGADRLRSVGGLYDIGEFDEASYR